MEAHGNMILLTCGLRRPSVSRERVSNLDREDFPYLVTFIVPSKHLLPNLFQFNVHISFAILSYATSGIAFFSFTSFIKFIANGERVGLVLEVCAIFETREEFNGRNEK
jgi:hypothetical protein